MCWEYLQIYVAGCSRVNVLTRTCLAEPAVRNCTVIIRILFGMWRYSNHSKYFYEIKKRMLLGCHTQRMKKEHCFKDFVDCR